MYFFLNICPSVSVLSLKCWTNFRGYTYFFSCYRKCKDVIYYSSMQGGHQGMTKQIYYKTEELQASLKYEREIIWKIYWKILQNLIELEAIDEIKMLHLPKFCKYLNRWRQTRNHRISFTGASWEALRREWSAKVMRCDFCVPQT